LAGQGKGGDGHTLADMEAYPMVDGGVLELFDGDAAPEPQLLRKCSRIRCR
jgi:hypothetical protein